MIDSFTHVVLSGVELIGRYCGVQLKKIQGGSNMTGTDLYVNKPHCATAVRP
jgi:hypothetical protein